MCVCLCVCVSACVCVYGRVGMPMCIWLQTWFHAVYNLCVTAIVCVHLYVHERVRTFVVVYVCIGVHVWVCELV